MKKKIVAVALAIGIVGSLSACSAGRNDLRNVEVSRLSSAVTTDGLKILTFNGYRFDSYELVENEDGSISFNAIIVPPTEVGVIK